MDINELLNKIDNDVLSEESKTQILDVFKQIVESKVEEAVDEKVLSALKEQDESHAKQLTQILEAIDKDHSEKMKKIISKIDEEHTEMLKSIVEKYEGMLTEEAKSVFKTLSKNVNDFLEISLDDVLPQDLLSESVKNTVALSKLEKVKEIVGIDETFINSHVKDALIDGKAKIEELQEQLNKVLKQNIKVSKEKAKFEKELIIEQKTKGLSSEKREFIIENFKGKDAKAVKENFDYVLKLYEKKEEQLANTLKEAALKESESLKVDTPEEKILEENNASEKHSYVESYVSALD